MSNEEVAEVMDYSVQSVYRMKKDATIKLFIETKGN
jgi:hypothetical protein